MSNSADEICLQIKQILIAVLSLSISPEEINEDDKLIEGGLFLESLTRLKLILELEKLFLIQFDAQELSLENYNSIKALAHYIVIKIQSQTTGG